MWRRSSSLFDDDMARSQGLIYWALLTQEITISTPRNVQNWNVDIFWSSCSIGLKFWWETNLSMLFHSHGQIFCRIPGDPEDQSYMSDWVEALTPKSSPPPTPNFLVFWLSLDTRSPAGRGEKLRPKLGVIECPSLLWRRETSGARHCSGSSTTPPRIGTEKRALCEDSDERSTFRPFQG